jgi:sugar lactone lactonase YvrE
VNLSPVSLLRDSTLLAESPCWHPEERALYFTDIPGGKIWRFDSASQQTRLFYEGEITGGLVPRQDGGWLLFQQKGLTWLDAHGKSRKTRPINVPGMLRFNDVIADVSGRVYAGTIGHDSSSGGLYRFELDGRCQCLFQGTKISNGMAFSPGDCCFYWTCTTTRTIYRFDYTAKDGALFNRQILYICPSNEGLPDGLTVDAEGNLWSARWGTGCVVILSPQGKKWDQVDFPESNITSLTWGGPDLQDLYVTAARGEGRPGIHALFVIPGAGKGRAENRTLL